MKVRVVPPDASWPARFAAEAERISTALAGLDVTVHHIGSTAIAGIYAKPVIDILLEVDDVTVFDTYSSRFRDLGYEAKGEFGIPGRRYFRRDSEAGVRTHQIHAFASRSEGLVRHLAFRDYMIAHPQIAQSYSNLKVRLAECNADDIEAYMDGKDAFIKEHESKSVALRTGAQPGATDNPGGA